MFLHLYHLKLIRGMKVLRIIILAPLAFFRLIMILLITAVVVIIGTIWLWLFGFSKKLQKSVMSVWGKSVLFVCGVKTYTYGTIQSERYILMPNHRSYLDIFIVAAYVPSSFVAKAELKNWPMTNTGARLTHMIFVSRSELKSLVTTMNRIKKSLSNKIPVTVFPEGTTYKGPLTKPFKKGTFKIAADAGISVIPMAIHFEDENDAWIDDDTFVGHFFRQMGKLVTKVHLQYGEPVESNDYNFLKENTRIRIDSMLKEIQAALTQTR
jgi:1-acyl-sn-glycerol-3-phosphate acyltransferase